MKMWLENLRRKRSTKFIYPYIIWIIFSSSRTISINKFCLCYNSLFNCLYICLYRNRPSMERFALFIDSDVNSYSYYFIHRKFVPKYSFSTTDTGYHNYSRISYILDRLIQIDKNRLFS